MSRLSHDAAAVREYIAGHQRQLAVQLALDALPTAERKVIKLRMRGETFAGIAALLCVPVSRVRTLNCRGLAALQRSKHLANYRLANDTESTMQ